jgi:hypothetical protein
VGQLNLVEAWIICERFGLHGLTAQESSVKEQKARLNVSQRFGKQSDTTESLDHGGSGQRYYQKTYKELSKMLALSKYRVQQIEQVALRKLRTYLWSSLGDCKVPSDQGHRVL